MKKNRVGNYVGMYPRNEEHGRSITKGRRRQVKTMMSKIADLARKSEWQPIPGYPGYYLTQQDVIIGKTGRPLKMCPVDKKNPDDCYLITSISRGNGPEPLYQHQAVALVRVPGHKPGMVVDHINRDKSDNRAPNLRWVSTSVNLLNNSSERSIKPAAVLGMSLEEFSQIPPEQRAYITDYHAKGGKDWCKFSYQVYLKTGRAGPLFNARSSTCLFEGHPPLMLLRTSRKWKNFEVMSAELGIHIEQWVKIPLSDRQRIMAARKYGEGWMTFAYELYVKHGKVPSLFSQYSFYHTCLVPNHPPISPDRPNHRPYQT